jgi:hypothetical protein
MHTLHTCSLTYFCIDSFDWCENLVECQILVEEWLMPADSQVISEALTTGETLHGAYCKVVQGWECNLLPVQLQEQRGHL